MTILSRKPVTLAEVKELVADLEEKQEIKDYLKTFTKLKLKEAKELIKEILELNNHKIKDENVVKVVDFVPKTAEEVNKIFAETSLSEEEINAILKITEKY